MGFLPFIPTKVVITVSALVGGVAWALGFLAAGLGHGTYVVMGALSSPLGLFNSVQVAWFGTPVLWVVLGALAGYSRALVARIGFVALAAAHYLAMIPILSNGERFGDWDYAKRATGAVAFCAVMEVLAHVFLWLVFVQRLFPRTLSGHCATCNYPLAGLAPGSCCPECGTRPPA
jgi:hypothetical protein